MTQIICSWLNEEVHISQFIDENNFATAFCNGYLIGEILKKYDLMDDFDKLSKKSTSEAKLNNFLLLEPILKLLGINFNNSVARDVMESKFSVLINLMYQIFIALENKKRSNITALSIQTMQAPATTHIQEMESGLFQQRMKRNTPRQSDIELKDLIKKYQEHQYIMQIKAEKDRIMSAECHKGDTEKHRQNCLNRSKFLREEQFETMKKIEAAVVKIPKPPPNKTIQAIQRNKKLRNQKEGEEALKDLDEFEKKQRNVIVKDKNEDILSLSREGSFTVSENGIIDDILPALRKSVTDTENILEFIQPKSNKEYIDRIKARLESDKEARIAREKRRRKVLVNCLKSHHQQEENERENMIAMRLMRQSQMERRIAVQLLHLRHEKNIIKANRLERENQYQERREKEFINALEKERVLIEQMKLVNMDNLRAEQELYDLKKSQNKMIKYRKHYEMSEKIVNEIIDLSCKTSEFNSLTEGNIPAKMMREWKLAFIKGVPIFDEVIETENVENLQSGELLSVAVQDITIPIEREIFDKTEMEKKMELLDEEDIIEYKQLIGEWQMNDETIANVDRQNNILNWIVDRLQNLSNLVDENSKIPALPVFPIKAAVVGKCFSGKSILIKNLVKNNRCVSIIPQDVINEALEAFENQEEVEIELPISNIENSKIDEDKTENQVNDINLNASMNDAGISLSNDESNTNNSMENIIETTVIMKKPSSRAILGEKIKEDLMNGKEVNDQLLVEIIIDKIRSIPEGTGWIIDDFPSTYQQAKLFEKAISGYEEPVSRSSRKSISKQTLPIKESGLDILILLNTSDRDCLARAMTISENQLNDKLDSSVVSKDVIANLQTSLTNFAEHWPKLFKFYSRINENLVKTVDSSQDMNPTQVYLQVEMILDEIIKQKETPEPLMDSLALPSVEIEPPVENKIPEVSISESDLNAVSKEVVLPKKSSGRRSKSSSRGSSAGSKSSSKKESSRKSRSKSKSESVNSKVDKKGSKKEAPKKQETDVKKRKGSKDSKGSKGSKSSSKGSRTGSGKRKKSKSSQPAEVEKVEELPVITVPEPQPGDADWVYANKPLNQELSSVFYEFWESLNGVYIDKCKHVFRDIRYDREEIIRYTHAIKKAFRMLLDRPDAKQEYIDQFQKDFNEINSEWREDEEVQQELHQRVSDLKDQLLEISQENQTDAENEMEKMRTNRWLEDRIGMISNQYLNLMQSEFDRFQDVVRFLRDYYKSMINPNLDEFKPEFLRLPLIEIPTLKDEVSEQQDLNVESNKSAIGNSSSPVVKKAPPKGAGKPQAGENQVADENKELTEEEIEAMFKTRIPLIEYRTQAPQIISAALSSIPVTGKQVKGDKSGGAANIAKLLAASKPDKKTDKPQESIIIPNDLDEKLLYDTLMSCFTLANAIVDLEMSQMGPKEETEKPPGNAGPDKSKADKKGKGGKKSRTPTPKKGAKDKTATNTSAKSRSRSGSAKKKGKGKNTPSKDVNVPQEIEENEEDKQNRLFLEKSKIEYAAALQKEISILRVNVKIIMQKGIDILKEIKNKIDLVFQTFSAWIADKLLLEDVSIKELEKVFRYHIEIKKPVKEKVVLLNHKFYLNPDLSMIPNEESEEKIQPLIIRPNPVDIIDDKYFNIFQLKEFNRLLHLITSPGSSVISLIDFVRFINESLMATDQKSLPSFISQSNHNETNITNIAEAFSCDKEYVNWRLFLLACSEPWPWPTQNDLINMLMQFKDLDQQNTGFITREQYEFIDLWVPIPSTPSTPVDVSIPKTINRPAEIKKLIFDIFKADRNLNEFESLETHHEIEYMDYEDMLMHFAIFCTNNFYSGIIRALSVSIGQSLPHIPVEFKDIELPIDPDDDSIDKSDAETLIPIQKLYKVLSFGHQKTTSFENGLENADLEDSECERDTTLIKSLMMIYETVGETDELQAPFNSLLKHDALLEWFLGCQWFRHVDLQTLFVDSTESFRISTES